MGTLAGHEKLTAVASAILGASFDAAFFVSDRGVIQATNDAATSLFGWSDKGEPVGRTIDAVLVGIGISEVESRAAAGVAETDEVAASKPDGTDFLVELRVAEVKVGDDAEPPCYCIFAKDRTELKDREAGIIGASFDATFTIDETGRIRTVNEAAVRQFGWSREEFVGGNISLIVAGKHGDLHDEYIRRYLKTGEKRVMGKKRELLARRKDGSTFPIELGLTEVKVAAGRRRRFCGYIKDLTDVKAHEAELEDREAELRDIIEASFDALFTIDETGTIQTVNGAAVRQFGWSREEFVGKNISMVVAGKHGDLHDEYIRRYLKTGEKRVMGKKRELLARRKDGSTFPIELGLAEVKVAAGRRRRFCGYINDLTDVKAHEAELENSAAVTKGVIESSFDALFTINETGIIQLVNEAAVKNFGWSREEFLGQNISMIVAPEHASKHDEYLRNYLRTGVTHVIGKKRELAARKRDGSLFPIILGVFEIEHIGGEERMFSAFIRDLTEEKKLRDVEIESAKAEALLLNMLPRDIAIRLQNDEEGHIADHYTDVAILFADIVGFTAMSSRMTPVEVVGMLNELFSMFDDLVEKYDLNKVKTIGDCYMVTSHPGVECEKAECFHMCCFALEMIEALHTYNRKNTSHNLNLRVGVNSGPVVAGVVGRKRFLYDLWGDAVNMASRMESTGIPGKIQVTKSVVDLTKNDFKFKSRGLVHVKGKGDCETFLLEAPKTVPSIRKSVRPSLSVLKSPELLLQSLRNLQSTRNLSGTETHVDKLQSAFEEAELIKEK